MLEMRTGRGERIEVGRLDVFGALATQVFETMVVGNDDDQIGTSARGPGGLAGS
jgi:hypothetical protein